MYCVHCGVQNPDNANFCSNCGKEQTDKSTEEVAEPQPKVHHPWMTAQPTQEEVPEVPQEETQQKAKGEMPEALKSILNRVKGWSSTKKTIWIIVIGCLFLVCVGVAVGEPVEETARPKPFLEALEIEFAGRGFEFHSSIERHGLEQETWRHPDGGHLRLASDDDYKSARLSFPLVDDTLTDEQQNAMKDFTEVAVPTWTEGRQWVTENLPITLSNPIPTASEHAAHRSRNFVKERDSDIVGNLERVEIGLTKNSFDERPVGVIIYVRLYN